MNFRFLRALWTSWPWRLARSVGALLTGVRLHPSAVLLGRSRQFQFGRRSVVDARVRIDAGWEGSIVIGEGSWLSRDVSIETATRLQIGTGTTVQRGCNLHGSARIGHGCILAPNVYVSSLTHPFRDIAHLPIRTQEQKLTQSDSANGADRPVQIQDDCWLGVNVVVCPGVTIGKGSVVGANAVVTRDVEPYSVVAGLPARLIGKRLNWRPPLAVDLTRREDLVYVLSGVPNDIGGTVRGILVTENEPLHVALAASASTAKIEFEMSDEVQVDVGQDAVRYTISGVGRLLLPLDPPMPNRFFSSLRLNVVREGSRPIAARLLVTSISAEDRR